MWKTITPAEMKRIETAAMAQGQCTGEALMARAAAAVARAAHRHWKQRGGMVIALCGTGNNGGDAIAAMRMLAADESIAGECWLMDGSLSPDALRELERLQRERPRIRVRRLLSDAAYTQTGVLTDADQQPLLLDRPVACLIDGLFGTGLSRPVTGVAAALCRLGRKVYESDIPVVAVDIPSGLCGRTGRVLGEAIPATETLTFHRPKPGLFVGQGLLLAGRVQVVEIGLQPAWDDADGLLVCKPDEIGQLLPRRSRIGHKGDHGRVVLLCGSFGMAGAAAIAATAALRSGAGLVTVACPERIVDTVQALCPCATCLPLEMDAEMAWTQLEPLLMGTDALGVGCGLGQSPWVRQLLGKLLPWLAEHPLAAVWDADALNVLASTEATPQALSRCVLTPHPGEAARLLGVSVAEVTADALESAEQLRKKYGAAVVLKGAASVLAAKEGAALNVLGTSAMGKGGSGDALTGVLCALLAERARSGQPASMLTVLQAGCGMHGLAGCIAEVRLGNRGVLATDLCACLGLAAEQGVNTLNSVLSDDAPANDAAIGEQAAQQATPATDEPTHGIASRMGAKASPLGCMVTVTVDRKLGETHPTHKDIVYRINYGYVQDVLAEDNEWQDAYIYGESLPLDVFEGEVVAVIHRLDDVEDKWVVASPGTRLTKEEVWAATRFVEQYFQVEIECL